MAKNTPAVPVNPNANKSSRKFDNVIKDTWQASLLGAGMLRAVHVLTPALMARFKDKSLATPVVAVRSSQGEFTRMRLYRHVEILGPSFLGEDFDNPLEGTGGRAVAVLFTEYPLNVWIDPANDLGTIDTKGKTPEQVMAEIEARLSAKKVTVEPAPVHQPAPARPTPRKPVPDGVGVGDKVRVVKGRKVPVGTTGKVFWVGDSQYGERVGIKDGDGETHWTALANVVVLAA